MEWKQLTKPAGNVFNLGEKSEERLKLLDRADEYEKAGKPYKALALRVQVYGDPSPDEHKNYGFANRMDKVEIGLSREIGEGIPLDMIGANTKENLKQLFPGWGANILASPEYRQYSQFKRDFINATLRRESGAAIAPSEFENADQQYFPVVGDDADTIAQKRANRAEITKGVRASGGRSNAINGYVPPKPRSEEPPQAPGAAAPPAAAPAAPQPAPAPVAPPVAAEAAALPAPDVAQPSALPTPGAAGPEATPAADIDPASFATMSLDVLEPMLKNAATMSVEAYNAMVDRLDELSRQ